MKTLVVGIDDDRQREAVMDWVSQFARDSGARVVLVHVLLRRAIWIVAGAQVDSSAYVASRRAHFERVALAPLRRRGITAELHLEIGSPAHVLTTTAKRCRADFIVVGGPHHGALHDAMLGNTVARLEHCADVPVVVMPQVGPAVGRGE
jgi:nucleotide-binding universal stress UspA family protein